MNKTINQAIKALTQPRPISSKKAQQLISCLYELTYQLEGLYELIANLEERYQCAPKDIEHDDYSF